MELTAWSNWCQLETLAFFTDFLTEVSSKIQISLLSCHTFQNPPHINPKSWLLPRPVSVMEGEMFFFPLSCKPLNNCQSSNMQQRQQQQHCTARNNAGFWGSLSQRFWREVVMDVAAVIEGSTTYACPCLACDKLSVEGEVGVCVDGVWQSR